MRVAGVCTCEWTFSRVTTTPCKNCGHPETTHDLDAGCTDGIDHPGSTSAPHGPSTEQWARGIALQAAIATMQSLGLMKAPHEVKAVADNFLPYILNGEK